MDIETKNKILQLEQQITELTNNLNNLSGLLKVHQHNNFDGTKQLNKSIKLNRGEQIEIDLLSIGVAPIQNIGSSSEQIQSSFGVGRDNRKGFFNQVKNMQLNFFHQPNSTLKQSFISGFRDAISGSISVNSGGNTATINGYNFIVNDLTGAIVNIINSSGALVESQIITSNTTTQITISGTWGASTTGTFFIYYPLFMGSADTIFQRFYTQEGTGGGIRFGRGVTAGGQNGLLYSDATGDLYWRNKGGTAVKLN